MQFPSARILIFAKAPWPERVKTRLIPFLSAQEAADLHADLVRDTVARLAGCGPAPIELWCAPDAGDPLFVRLAAAHELTLHRQRGRDLGERMGNAAADALRSGDSVVLVGTDCPSLDADYVSAALEALRDKDAVLGPAEDGGYVLLGLRRAAPWLFPDMPWGGSQVAELTRERMSARGWDWAELPRLWDVDRPEDLKRLNAGG